MRINPLVQQRTFSTSEEFSRQKSDDTDLDLPDLESDSDSDADTAVPADDDFMSVEDDDRVYCHICDMWIDGDLDHEHVFLNTNE